MLLCFLSGAEGGNGCEACSTPSSPAELEWENEDGKFWKILSGFIL